MKQYSNKRILGLIMGFCGLFVALLLIPALLIQHFYFERICAVHAQANGLGTSWYSPASRYSPESCFFANQGSIPVNQLVGWQHKLVLGIWLIYRPLGAFGLTLFIFMLPWPKLKRFKNIRL
ncbi:hypothetical protein [Herpetosiphon geysericola]|uniref:Uncharacterized protein n=1 Tax=Herpetosiphon geysericola TaxID=70996 RepID=A0A0P6Y1U1_9CHLR|nr:hypothetical protein [Herpetosiphon geysericola]KPL85840.1 hypothetical protein SE18_12990 [Herpetosiphon geysericola]